MVVPSVVAAEYKLSMCTVALGRVKRLALRLGITSSCGSSVRGAVAIAVDIGFLILGQVQDRAGVDEVRGLSD